MDLFNDNLIVPANLRFFLHRLADSAQPSTNLLKINAMNSTTASSGALITVRLPMSLVDLNSFAWYFNSNVTNGTDSAAGSVPATLPKGIEGIISRMEVSVNGLGLMNLQNYNLLYSILKESHMDIGKAMARRVLQNESDVAPILTADSTYTNFPITINTIAYASATTLTCTCAGLYPIINGQVIQGFPSGIAGITYPTATGTYTISNTGMVRAYTQTVNSQVINGPYVSTFTLTIGGTSAAVANQSYTSVSPMTVILTASQITSYATGCSAGHGDDAGHSAEALLLRRAG